MVSDGAEINFVHNLQNIRLRRVRNGSVVVFGLLNVPIYVKQSIHTVAFPVIYYAEGELIKWEKLTSRKTGNRSENRTAMLEFNLSNEKF